MKTLWNDNTHTGRRPGRRVLLVLTVIVLAGPLGTVSGLQPVLNKRSDSAIWTVPGGPGWIDPARGEVIVESVMPLLEKGPRVPRKQAAHVRARKLLDDLIRRVPVTSQELIASFDPGGEIPGPVADAIRLASADLTIVDELVSPDQTVTLTATADLRRYLLKELFTHVRSTYTAANRRSPAAKEKTQKVLRGQGLIIDARGLRGVVPALAPRILDANGEVLYGLSEHNRTCAVEQGLVGYRRTLEPAVQKAVVQGAYRRVRALGVAGAIPADLVISRTDKDALLSLARDSDAFEQCRVIVLTD